MNQDRIILWYRNDLRVHDHEPLDKALKIKAQIIPIYCFDPRQFGQTNFGFPKTGAFRANFLIESIAELRNSLQKLGSNLIIRQQKPEIAIPQLAQELKVKSVFFHQEVTAEEIQVEKALHRALKQIGVKFQPFWGNTLYHPDDLPFEITQLPEVFTSFRKEIEKKSTINLTFSTPEKLPFLPEVELGELPTLSKLNLELPPQDSRAVLAFRGGETAGKERVKNYFWQEDCLKVYKETRNGMLGANYSSKFSPWLALGCLSPRYIYEQVQEYEERRVKNNSTYWLIFELLWRDYFRFICQKHGNKIFYKSGLQGVDIPWQEDWEKFRKWQEGKTGFPLVDANMRELLMTGFMSNRGRQNVASFLTKNLGINWQIGAEWFESLLIDYDVCSNWGNWNYTAGVGNDARGFRYFNIPKQAKDYDPEGKYVKHWLPELEAIPASKIHEPGKLSTVEQKKFGVKIGVDYPQPMIDLWQSVKENEKNYNAALKPEVGRRKARKKY
ncbi:DASH family cryptochrome [Okeania sp. SIO2B3]|uniref:DASH family cryptochrome n=1 Tax=Okeania sp. SIO2B3 TaxID=2607784 RepID=UPI0013C21D01|nr:DASH family cryptochrome [Okeania sp. SIO2B3]NET43829.1 DASH family cryptochrome [Okeania sp. SIO2B3]